MDMGEILYRETENSAKKGLRFKSSISDEVSAWNSEFSTSNFWPASTYKQSAMSFDLSTKRRSVYNTPDVRGQLKKQPAKLLSTSTPVAYKVSNIYLNDKQDFIKEKPKRKLFKRNEFPKLSRQRMACIFSTSNKRQEMKLLPGFDQLLNSLKTEHKPPVSKSPPLLKARKPTQKFFSQRLGSNFLYKNGLSI